MRKLFRAGNSTVVSLPKDILESLCLAEGTEVVVELDRERRRIILTPVSETSPEPNEALARRVAGLIWEQGSISELEALIRQVARSDSAISEISAWLRSRGHPPTVGHDAVAGDAR